MRAGLRERETRAGLREKERDESRSEREREREREREIANKMLITSKVHFNFKSAFEIRVSKSSKWKWMDTSLSPLLRDMQRNSSK
jgi:hypothetical protein